MTAPAARLGRHLRRLPEFDRQIVRAAVEGDRCSRDGDTAESARCYTRACALAHVWTGIGGAGDAEAGRDGGLRGHYALRANACDDWNAAGPPPREADDPGRRLPPAPGSLGYAEADARWTAHLRERTSGAGAGDDLSDLIDRG